MKKTLILIAIMFFGMSSAMLAQNEEDEYVVTDENGDEEVIDVPEALTLEVDSLLNQYYSQMYLEQGNDCNFTDVNPTFDTETYIERLRRLPALMELPYNEVVRKFIDRYSGRLRRSVAFWLGAANFYMPIFEQALETYNLPLELKYLPVIESGLTPTAVSRVGATGLWQFMLSTGRQYGLKVNTLVDERRDPIKASYAAARYLRDLYRIFGDWNLVIAAYNCGPERINRAIHRADGEKDYWKIYPYLPQETRGYVPAFIAANYIMNYYCDHNICPMLEELRTLNPQYRHDIVNGNSEPSAIRLPLHVINTFIDNEDSIYVYDAENLLTRRDIADVDDSQPIYKAYKRKGYSRGKASRRGKHVKAGRKGRHKVSGSKKSRKNKSKGKRKRRRR